MVETIEQLQERLMRVEHVAQEAEDKAAISRLLIDLQTAMDERDLEKYGSYYADDGEWCAISGRAIGPAQITSFLRQYCLPWESEAQRTYHSLSDVTIDVVGDTATAWGQWRHYHPGDKGEPLARHFGHFEAILARTATGWHIKRRASYGDLPYSTPKYQLIGLVEGEAAASSDGADKTTPVLSDHQQLATEVEGNDHSLDMASRLSELEGRLHHAEQRVRAIEDREAIHRAFIELQSATDARDAEKYGQCFTIDGEWSGVSGRAVGRAEITEYMARFFQPWQDEASRTYHSISDVSIELHGDIASARAQYRHLKLGEDDHPTAFHFGHFDALLARTSAGWRFKRRDGYVDLPYYEPVFQLVGRSDA